MKRAFDDLPIIQLRPTPTDAELEAERDAKYAEQLSKEEIGTECRCTDYVYYPCDCGDWPVGEVAG